MRVVWHRSLFCVPVCLGLLYAGDKLVEVNGVSVEGLDPEQVIHILVTALLSLSMTDCGIASSPWNDWRGIRVTRAARPWSLSVSTHLVPLTCSLPTAELDPAGDVPSQAALSASRWQPRSSSPGLPCWKLSPGWAEWDCGGESEPEQTTPCSSNIFMQFLWGSFEVEKKSRGQHMGRGTSLLALPVLVLRWGFMTWLYELLVSFWFSFPSFKPLPGSLFSCQYSQSAMPCPPPLCTPHSGAWGRLLYITYTSGPHTGFLGEL